MIKEHFIQTIILEALRRGEDPTESVEKAVAALKAAQ